MHSCLVTRCDARKVIICEAFLTDLDGVRQATKDPSVYRRLFSGRTRRRRRPEVGAETRQSELGRVPHLVAEEPVAFAKSNLQHNKALIYTSLEYVDV